MILLIFKLIYFNLMLANTHSFLLWGDLIVGLHSNSISLWKCYSYLIEASMFSFFVILQHIQWMYRTSFFFLFFFFFFFLRGSCGELPIDCQFSLEGYWYILVVACPILYICICMLWSF